MNPASSPPVAQLKSVLEARMDAMSSSAQMALDAMTRQQVEATLLKDIARVHQSSCEAYGIVHQRLTPEQFTGDEGNHEEVLHLIRHDLRGKLQTVLLRSRMVLEDGAELEEGIKADIGKIMEHARFCVQMLNASRDADEDALPWKDAVALPPGDGLRVPGTPSPLIAGAQILVVDDSEESRETLGLFLQREGHRVEYARNGREAWDMIQRHEYDLVLLDLVMPEMNGFEVLSAMRDAGVLRHTPVLLISGRDSDENAVHGIELGADDFLPRPVDLKLLRARVNACVERQRLRERELAQYFTPELARHLLRHPEKLSTGRQTEVTVLFCDIVGFSRVSEQIGPEQSIRWVSSVLSVMSDCVMSQLGVLVDYTGDQVMALWGAPRDQPNHADLACRCAQEMMSALPGLNREWENIIAQPTRVSIGMNTGGAYVGNIGTPQKFKYGAFGNTVNLASRVQSSTKFVHSETLFTGQTRSQLKIQPAARRLCRVRVNNIASPVDLFELAGPELNGREEIYVGYEEALNAFESARLEEARVLLEALAKKHPEDRPTKNLLTRVTEASKRPSDQEFNPVWVLPGK